MLSNVVILLTMFSAQLPPENFSIAAAAPSAAVAVAEPILNAIKPALKAAITPAISKLLPPLVSIERSVSTFSLMLLAKPPLPENLSTALSTPSTATPVAAPALNARSPIPKAAIVAETPVTFATDIPSRSAIDNNSATLCFIFSGQPPPSNLSITP